MSESRTQEIERKKLKSNRYIFILIFLVTNALAFLLVPLYVNTYTQSIKSSSGNNYGFPVFYIVLTALFSAIFIFLARRNRISVLKLILYIAVGYSLLIIFLFDLAILPSLLEISLSFVLTIIILYFVYKNNNISLTILGIILGSGISLLLASIFTIQISIIIVAIFSVYDALSVVLIGSMVEMAETALDNKIPLLFSYGEKEEKIAMGFGDVIIPTFFLFSIYVNIGFTPYIISLIMASVSFILINYLAKKSPQPGLPFIINFIFIGLIFYLLF